MNATVVVIMFPNGSNCILCKQQAYKNKKTELQTLLKRD